MTAHTYIPTDAYERRLLSIYARAEKRLLYLIEQAQQAERENAVAIQSDLLRQVQAEVLRLTAVNGPEVRAAIFASYAVGALAIDKLIGDTTPPAFGRIHRAAAETLAKALEDRLDDAARTVGRNARDAIREATLTILAEQQLTAESTAIAARRLRAELERQGMTAFVDKSGRRWRLATYARMAVRTSLREAVTVAEVTRLMERGVDLVEWSDHNTECDICGQYEGRTFSLSGQSSRYPRAVLPPAHPNCLHVIVPARVRFEDFERAVEASIGGTL